MRSHDQPERLDVDAALRLTKAGRCYACGEEVEAALAELGSALCHDCRPLGGKRRQPGPSATTQGD